MLIRDATKKDCKACEQLSRIDELKAADGSHISEKYFLSFVDQDKMFFIAEENKKVAGYILGEPLKGKVALLGMLTVDERERGKGIGKKLVARFRERCMEKKIEAIFFYAPAFNKSTIAFYEKQGFKKGHEHIAFLEVM
jgi:ribosomal protein S18 acetylase RimI-like enzyme